MPKTAYKYKERKCCICGGNDTYIYQGSPKWHIHRCNKENCTGYICYSCSLVGSLKTSEYLLKKRELSLRFKGRKCCICENEKSDGNCWFRNYDNKENWTGEWICKTCYSKIYQRDNSYSPNNIKKSLRNCRIGNLNRFDENGKGIIGQWIVLKTLGIGDFNIENDNFRYPIDSYHSIYGKIDVKTATSIDEKWQFAIRRFDFGSATFDTIIILCMDRYELWKDVERSYIIPKEGIENFVHTSITKNHPGRYEKYRTDEKSFNDTYHSVDIPDPFSPLDLWSGKYNIS